MPRRIVPTRLLSGQRRHEAVAAAGDRRDVANPLPTVSERLAKAGDLEPQAALVDKRVGPHLCEKIPLPDDLVRPRDQRGQDINGPISDLDRYPVPRQQPLPRREQEGPERDEVAAARR